MQERKDCSGIGGEEIKCMPLQGVQTGSRVYGVKNFGEVRGISMSKGIYLKVSATLLTMTEGLINRKKLSIYAAFRVVPEF